MKEKDERERERQEEVWILEKIMAATPQCFLSNLGRELQITPSGIIEVVDFRVLGYCSKDL
jgi:predicted transcriptional regulator